MYFSDYYNHVIRKVTVSTSIITTIAGVASAGYSGDNGPATTAGLYYPYGVALDSSGIDLHYSIAYTNSLCHYSFPR